MDNYLIGLDFGACGIKIARYDEKRKNGRSLKIDDNESNSDNTIANIILYEGRDQYQVGRSVERKIIAERRQSEHFSRENVIDYIKRHLEERNWKHEFPDLGFTLNAVEVATDIFTYLRHQIEAQGRQIENAVITTPVCFSEVQKARILKAAANAGIPVKCTLSEPVAALYSLDDLFEKPCDEEIVVFDFGGSTLDLCLFHARNAGNGNVDIDIEASCGLALGGADITRMIYEEILYPKYKERID